MGLFQPLLGIKSPLLGAINPLIITSRLFLNRESKFPSWNLSLIKLLALQSPLIQTSKFLSTREEETAIGWDKWDPIDWDEESSVFDVNSFDSIFEDNSESNNNIDNVNIENRDTFTKILAIEPEINTQNHDSLIARGKISATSIAKKTDKSKGKSQTKKAKTSAKVNKTKQTLSKNILSKNTTQIHQNESELVAEKQILSTATQPVENLSFTEEINSTQIDINLDNTTNDSIENQNIQELLTSPDFEEESTLFKHTTTDEDSVNYNSISPITQTPSHLNSDKLQNNQRLSQQNTRIINKKFNNHILENKNFTLEEKTHKDPILPFSEDVPSSDVDLNQNQQQFKAEDISTNSTAPLEDIDLALLFSIINNQNNSSPINTSDTPSKQGEQLQNYKVNIITNSPKINELPDDVVSKSPENSSLSHSPSLENTPTLFTKLSGKGKSEISESSPVTDVNSDIVNRNIFPTPEISPESTKPITPNLSPQLTEDEITDYQVKFTPDTAKNNGLTGDTITPNSIENQPSQSPSFGDKPTLSCNVVVKGESKTSDLSSVTNITPDITNNTISPTPEISPESTKPVTSTLPLQLTDGEKPVSSELESVMFNPGSSTIHKTPNIFNKITQASENINLESIAIDLPKTTFIPSKNTPHIVLKDSNTNKQLLTGDVTSVVSDDESPKSTTINISEVINIPNVIQNPISPQPEINLESINSETGETNLNPEVSPSTIISDSAEIKLISPTSISNEEVETLNIFNNSVSEQQQVTPILDEDATFDKPPFSLNKVDKGKEESSSATLLRNSIIPEFYLTETNRSAFAKINSQDIVCSSNQEEKSSLFAIDEQADIENLPNIKGYATGGQVKDYQKIDNQQIQSSDTVSAMLTPGEFVINVRDAQKNLDLLEHINSGGEPEKIISPDSQTIKPEAEQYSIKVESLTDGSIQHKNYDSLISSSLGRKFDNHQISVLNPSLTNSFENDISSVSESITNYSSPPLVFRQTKSPTHTPSQWNNIEDLLNGGNDEFTIFNFNNKESHRQNLDNSYISPSSSASVNIFAKHLTSVQSFADGGEVIPSDIATEAAPLTETIQRPSSKQEEDDNSAELETLAREIYNRLQQRLEIERERQGFYSGRLPW